MPRLNDSIVDNDTTVSELQKLVEKLQTVNQTLTSTYISMINFFEIALFILAIDAALTGPINDDAFV